MTPARPVGLILGLLVACSGGPPCADETAAFELPAPGDEVELLVRACGPEGLELASSLTLARDPAPSGPLAILVDGITIDPAASGWGGVDGQPGPVGDADCEPGRRITVRRLDDDATVSVSGSLTVALTASASGTCSAAITTTPSPRP